MSSLYKGVDDNVSIAHWKYVKKYKDKRGKWRYIYNKPTDKQTLLQKIANKIEDPLCVTENQMKSNIDKYNALQDEIDEIEEGINTRKYHNKKHNKSDENDIFIKYANKDIERLKEEQKIVKKGMDFTNGLLNAQRYHYTSGLFNNEKYRDL